MLAREEELKEVVRSANLLLDFVRRKGIAPRLGATAMLHLLSNLLVDASDSEAALLEMQVTLEWMMRDKIERKARMKKLQ